MHLLSISFRGWRHLSCARPHHYLLTSPIKQYENDEDGWLSLPGIQMPKHNSTENIDQDFVLEFIDAQMIEMPGKPWSYGISTATRRTHRTHKLKDILKCKYEKRVYELKPVYQSVSLEQSLFCRTRFHDQTTAAIIQ